MLLNFSNATVLVGSPPKNIGKAFRDFPSITLTRWIQQGGFAGDNVVSTPLKKFKGRITCQSFNPGGAWKETLELLSSQKIKQRFFISKNVCHGVLWSSQFQARLKNYLNNNKIPIRTGLSSMIYGLDLYYEIKQQDKALHDLVAAACVFDENVCKFKEVEIYREKGEWGARETSKTNTWISVEFNQERFIEVIAK